MLQFSKKKTIISIIGFIISVILAGVFIYLDTPGNLYDLSTTAVIIRISILLSFTLALFFITLLLTNFKVALYLSLLLFLVFGIKVFNELIFKTNTNNSLFFMFAILLVMLLYLIIQNYTSTKVAINGINYAKLSPKKLKSIQLQEENNSFIKDVKTKINYMDNSLIVSSQVLGKLYQLIKYHGYFVAHYIGSLKDGLDDRLLITDFDNINYLIDNVQKNDFVIEQNNISAINAVLIEDAFTGIYGTITIKQRNGKTKKLTLVFETLKQELENFFGEKIVVKDKNLITSTQSLTQKYVQKLNKINTFLFVFSIVSILLFALYPIIEFGSAYKVLSLVYFLIVFISYIVCIFLQKYLIVLNPKNSNKCLYNDKIIYWIPLSVFPILFAFTTLISLANNVVDYDYVKMLIISLIVFIVLFAIFLVFVKQDKKGKSIALILGALILFSPASVITLNSSLDFTQPQEVYYEVIEKPLPTTYKNKLKYKIKLSYEDKQLYIDVDKDEYNTINVGDQLTMIKQNGLFGIEITKRKLEKQ